MGNEPQQGPKPGDKEYLERAARALKCELPDNKGFILFTIDTNTPNSYVAYISDIRREDAIAALKTWLIKSSGEEEWMKHIR